MACEVATDAGKKTAHKVISLLATESGAFPWLSKLTRAYSQIEWHSLYIFWKPAVGANSEGRLIYAVDVDGLSQDPPDRATVASHSPVCDIQIWQDNENRPMVVPRELLTSRRRFLLSTNDPGDSGPGNLLWYVSGPANTVLGEIWCRYSVRLLGPK